MITVRWAGVLFALVQIVTFYADYPPGAKEAAFLLAGSMALGNAGIWIATRRRLPDRAVGLLPMASLALDLLVLLGFVAVYSFDPETSIWAILYILPLEGALLYERRGALAVMGLASVGYALREFVGSIVYDYELLPFSITFRMGIGFIIAAVAGATTSRLAAERDRVRESERRLARINQRLVTVMANLPGMAYRCHNDADWTLDFVSDGALDLTGHPAESLVGDGGVSYGELIHPEDRDRVWREVQAAIWEGHPFQLEYRIVTPEGAEKWVWEQGRMVHDPDGETRLEGLIIDATERKRLENDLAQSQKMEAVGRLAGGIAHDFNNLLAVVTSYASMLAEDVPKESQARSDLQEIYDAGVRGAALIRQLLAFSRQQIIAPEVLEVRDVVEEMMNLLKRAVGEHIQLSCSPEETDRVLLDHGQLEQIVMNLVVNARDAMPRGGRIDIRTASVDTLGNPATTTTPSPQRCVVMSVTDAGHGISAETQEHIFEPFFTTKPAGAGTGLGLATTYGIVERAGGWVEVTSEVGVGTRFDVYLPVTAQQPDQQLAVGDASVVPARTSSILVVEDEAPVREVVERILRRQGHEVVTKASAAEALDWFGSHQAIDLVITDVVMPGLSGRAMVDQLRRRGIDIQVIYMSGYDEQMVSEQGGLREEDVLLQKPFSAGDLLELVSASLGNR